MIPRYQRIVYWTLVAGTLLLLALLLRGCVRNHERIAAMRDQSPIAAPTDIASAQVPIALANDADGSVTLDQLTLPLPEDPSLRIRTLLDRILSDDSQAASTHPVPAGPAVTDVFLLNLPLTPPGISTTPAGLGNAGIEPAHSQYGDNHAPGSQLAVVNLTKAFADAHPSGIASEDLTLRLILATIHANLPQVEEVRFLVDGQPRDTLNGHADLTRPYAMQNPAKAIHVLSPDGDPL